ncbi:MAG: dihydroorotase [Thermoplasmata archaeon]
MKVISGKFFYNDEIKEIDVGIEEGKIVEIKKHIVTEERYEFPEGVIIPSMVDMHVHFREPGYTWKEDFESGSLSALHGGVTFYIDMPNTNPPTNSLENFILKYNLAKSKSYVDFGIAYLLDNKVEKNIEDIVTSFKIYMSETTNVKPLNPLIIPEITKDITKNITVHAEWPECIKKYEENNLNDHDKNRPETCEIKAVRFLVNNVDGKIHIAHVSSPDSVDIALAKKFTTEVTPHHLFLNKNMQLGAFGKVNPPLRSEHVSGMLLEYLSSGIIDVVASDHSPHSPEEKENFNLAPSGLPGVETSMPLLLMEMKRGNISLNRLVKVVSENPGKLLNIKKGKIELGYDADFVIFHLSSEKRIKAKNLHYKCGWTPFENMDAIFPDYVFIRGEMAIKKGEEIINPGYGKYYPENEFLK